MRRLLAVIGAVPVSEQDLRCGDAGDSGERAGSGGSSPRADLHANHTPPHWRGHLMEPCVAGTLADQSDCPHSRSRSHQRIGGTGGMLPWVATTRWSPSTSPTSVLPFCSHSQLRLRLGTSARSPPSQRNHVHGATATQTLNPEDQQQSAQADVRRQPQAAASLR